MPSTSTSSPSNASTRARARAGIEPHHARTLGQQGQQIDGGLLGILGSCVQPDLVQRAKGALREHREAAQGVDLVAPELHPHRVALGGREHVDEAAPHRELAGVLHLVHADIAEGHQFAGEGVEVHPHARGQGQRRPRRRDDPLHETGGFHDHHGLGRSVRGRGPGDIAGHGRQSGDRPGPASSHARLDIPFRPVPDPPGRQIHHRPIGQIQRELVLEFHGRVLIGGDHEERRVLPGPAARDSGGQEGMDKTGRGQTSRRTLPGGGRGAFQGVLKRRVPAQEVGQAGHETSPRPASHSSARSAAAPMTVRTSSRGSLKLARTWSMSCLLG